MLLMCFTELCSATHCRSAVPQAEEGRSTCFPQHCLEPLCQLFPPQLPTASAAHRWHSLPVTSSYHSIQASLISTAFPPLSRSCSPSSTSGPSRGPERWAPALHPPHCNLSLPPASFLLIYKWEREAGDQTHNKRQSFLLLTEVLPGLPFAVSGPWECWAPEALCSALLWGPRGPLRTPLHRMFPTWVLRSHPPLASPWLALQWSNSSLAPLPCLALPCPAVGSQPRRQ